MMRRYRVALRHYIRNHPRFGVNAPFPFALAILLVGTAAWSVFAAIGDGFPFRNWIGPAAAPAIFYGVGAIIETVVVAYRLSGTAIRSAPGARLAYILSVLMTKKDYERIFAQSLGDMREEYFEALQAGRPGLARWRHIQFYISTVSMLFLLAASKLGRLVQAAWRLTGPG